MGNEAIQEKRWWPKGHPTAWGVAVEEGSDWLSGCEGVSKSVKFEFQSPVCHLLSLPRLPFFIWNRENHSTSKGYPEDHDIMQAKFLTHCLEHATWSVNVICDLRLRWLLRLEGTLEIIYHHYLPSLPAEPSLSGSCAQSLSKLMTAASARRQVPLLLTQHASSYSCKP